MNSAPLAPYAARPERSRGRLYPEPESPSRTAFQRDRDRIIHSTAFRRLQYKTQVFVYHEGDHYRTRLTHSLEVAQIARSLARCLDLNEDLAEALALAHDLGHTPFGHAGEEALDAAMKPFGGFSHNDQTLRILTSLERRYADFDGLNLTWETLEGTVKHNGPVTPPYSDTVRDYNARQDLALDTWPSAEAQAAGLSDDIAYDNHDIDDGVRAGLFSLDDLKDVPLIGEAIAQARGRNIKMEESRLIHEIGPPPDRPHGERRGGREPPPPRSGQGFLGRGCPPPARAGGGVLGRLCASASWVCANSCSSACTAITASTACRPRRAAW